jgi:hypothetical protein
VRGVYSGFIGLCAVYRPGHSPQIIRGVYHVAIHGAGACSAVIQQRVIAEAEVVAAAMYVHSVMSGD